MRAILIEELRALAPSVIGLQLELKRGPYRVGNWRIAKLDVLAIDYGRARDRADELEDCRRWVMVPDEHPFANGH